MCLILRSKIIMFIKPLIYVVLLYKFQFTVLAVEIENVLQPYSCQPIVVPLCQKLGRGYNATVMPNYFGHQNQHQVINEIQVYGTVVQSNCSRYVRFFLCSLYTPLCSELVVGAIPPCRNLCEQVASDCFSLIVKNNIPWPEHFNCSKFPNSDKDNLCMQFKKQDNIPKNNEKCICPVNHVIINNEVEASCRAECDKDVNYTINDKKLIDRWMVAWAILCFISTSFTLLTLILDTARLKYPEQPIIFLVLCYNLISILYIVKYFIGYEAIICKNHSSNDNKYVVNDGLDNPLCLITFLLNYYLHLSGNIWWLILSLTWYLSAGKKWSSEALYDLSSYFHCIAWALPCFLSILTLSLHNVTGNELTGLCDVSKNAILLYLVVPHVLILAFICIIAVYTDNALICIKRHMSLSGRNVLKLEKLTSRLILFQLFYIIPSVSVVLCMIYEAFFVKDVHNYDINNNNNCKNEYLRKDVDVEIALIKIFSILFIGIMSGMWIWSQKTCTTWANLVSILNKRNEPFPRFQI